MDRGQTHRETSLHASKSGEARFGGLSGTLALEQFPRLFPGRGRSSASQRVGCAQDEDPTSGRVTRSRTVSAVREAPARKTREGAPLPVCFGWPSKTNPRYTFHLMWTTPLRAEPKGSRGIRAP